MKISDQHHPNAPISQKRVRLNIERANHQAFVCDIPGVNPHWYNAKRFHSGRKQIMVYTGRDTVVWLHTAIRSAPPSYDMTRAETVRKGVMLASNSLRPAASPAWDAQDFEPVERGTTQSDITMTMLLKAQHALELAVNNALDYKKSYAQSLWNLHKLLTEQILLLRPSYPANYLKPIDELLDLGYIHELPPGVSPDPKWTPEMTPEYIAKRRAERAQWYKDNAAHVAKLEAGFKLDKPIEELNPNYKRNPTTTLKDDEDE